MSKPNNRRKIIAKNLFKKMRLLVINEDTLEEKFSLRLTLMNVFVVLTLGAIIIISVTTYIIAFTPLREYIPGYSSSILKKSATELAIKSDSLETIVRQNNIYIESIKKVLNGDLQYAQLNKDSIVAAEQLDPAKFNLEPTPEEVKLREQIDQEDKYNLFEKTSAVQNMVLFAPTRGNILKKFDVQDKQFGVEINVVANAPIKAVTAGTVIFSSWTLSDGYVVILRHKEGLLSVYKKCASVTKSQGDMVRTGEVIALGGLVAKNASGVHLLFELWKDGYPIDPASLIEFE